MLTLSLHFSVFECKMSQKRKNCYYIADLFILVLFVVIVFFFCLHKACILF